jgi:hypothetical protein
MISVFYLIQITGSKTYVRYLGRYGIFEKLGIRTSVKTKNYNFLNFIVTAIRQAKSMHGSGPKTQYRKQCCGSGMFIPDPNFFHHGSRVKKISDPGSGSASKNLVILHQKLFLSRKYDLGCLCRIGILIFYPSRIPGSKRHADRKKVNRGKQKRIEPRAG